MKSLQTDGRTDRQKTNDQKLSGTLSIINKALQILTICGDQGDAVKFDVNFAAISVTYHFKKNNFNTSIPIYESKFHAPGLCNEQIHI